MPGTFLDSLFSLPSLGPSLSLHSHIRQHSGSSASMTQSLVAEMERGPWELSCMSVLSNGCQHFCKEVKAKSIQECQLWSQTHLSSNPASGSRQCTRPSTTWSVVPPFAHLRHGATESAGLDIFHVPCQTSLYPSRLCAVPRSSPALWLHMGSTQRWVHAAASQEGPRWSDFFKCSLNATAEHQTLAPGVRRLCSP